MFEYPLNIQTYDSGTDTWSVTTFESKREFSLFILKQTKYPGRYNLRKTRFWKQQYLVFQKKGYYTEAVTNSLQYIQYWKKEIDKCKAGVIIDGFYIPPFYYFYLNYLEIYIKEKKTVLSPAVWDSDYHFMLYIMRCILEGKHAAVVKTRQRGYSYKIAAILYWSYCWFKSSVNSIGASDKSYVERTWTYLDSYRNFVNVNTPWIRGPQTPKTLEWQERKLDEDGNWIGNNSSLRGLSFNQSPTKGVGGYCHPKGTKILMSNGRFKNIEDVHLTDFIMGADGKAKKVTKLFNGISDIYVVRQSRGENYRVTKGHKLYLKNRDSNVSDRNRYTTITPEDFIKLSDHKKRTLVGIKNSIELDFDTTFDLDIDPYFLGLWLGDGYRNLPKLIINKTKDPEILQWVEDYFMSDGISYTVRNKEVHRYNDKMVEISAKISNIGQDSTILKAFVKYNLLYNKHIPDDYLYSSPENRLRLLAGILDTDGYSDVDNGSYEICVKDYRLREQIKFLCRSLGMYVNETVKDSAEHLVHGRIIRYTQTNNLSISCEQIGRIPCLLPRKKQPSRKSLRCKLSTPIIVAEDGVEEYFGFECEDHLYMLEDLTITHNCSFFFYEEAGVAPTMLETIQYMIPALRSGNETTGTIIVSGSVGDLEDCEPLKKLCKDPETYGFLGVTNTFEENPDNPIIGFFVPDSWSLTGFMDEDGNSLIEEAERFILDRREQIKKSMSAEEYQLEVSQNPLNLSEAFAFRKTSYFPQHLCVQQQERVLTEKPYLKNVELYEDSEGKIKHKLLDNGNPITKFPISEREKDKSGCVVIHEWPEPDASHLTYFAGVDPVATDSTTTSESLFAIYIFKNLVETKYEDPEDGTIKYKVTGFRPVAWYVGRMEDMASTNRIGEYLLRFYNAKAAVESNVQSFINHMQSRNMTRYLFSKQEIGFLEDLKANLNVHKQYGVHMTPLIKSYLFQNVKEYITEVQDQIRKKDTDEVVKTIYGIERITDIGLLEELKQYRDGINTDRLVAYSLALSIAKHFAINGVMIKKTEGSIKEKKPQPVQRSFFKSADNYMNPIPVTRGKSFFKTLA